MTICVECGSPAGHKLTCGLGHMESIAKINKLHVEIERLRLQVEGLEKARQGDERLATIVAKAIKRAMHEKCCTGAALDDICRAVNDDYMWMARAAIKTIRNNS
jgi:hypothetical protein